MNYYKVAITDFCIKRDSRNKPIHKQATDFNKGGKEIQWTKDNFLTSKVGTAAYACGKGES